MGIPEDHAIFQERNLKFPRSPTLPTHIHIYQFIALLGRFKLNTEVCHDLLWALQRSLESLENERRTYQMFNGAATKVTSQSKARLVKST